MTYKQKITLAHQQQKKHREMPKCRRKILKKMLKDTKNQSVEQEGFSGGEVEEESSEEEDEAPA